MLSIKAAYSNITKDSEWKKKLLIYYGFFSFLSILNLLTDHSFYVYYTRISQVFSSLCNVLKLFTVIVLTGYPLVYLNKIIIDKNEILPKWNIEYKKVITAGIKTMCASGVTGLIIGLIVSFVICISKFIHIKLTISDIYLIVFLGIIVIGLYYLALFINFAANNLKILALLDFERAAKYFGKDYFICLLFALCLNTLPFLLVILGKVINLMFVSKLVINIILMTIFYSICLPFVSIAWLIITNLLAQIYYSKKKNYLFTANK